MKREFSKFAKSLALLFMVGALTATSRAGDYFSDLDGNEDGVLSGRELEYLSSLDTNKDGDITRDEFTAELNNVPAGGAKKLEAKFKELDINEDGRLSGTEMTDYRNLDANQDNRLTLEEFMKSQESELRLLALNASDLKAEALVMFQVVDANQDGAISGQEAVGFEKVDADLDGKILREEFVSAVVLRAMATKQQTGDTEPVPPVTGPEFLKIIVDAIQSRDATLIHRHAAWGPGEPLQTCLTQYAIELLAKELGTPTIPPDDAYPDPETGSRTWEIPLSLERGQLRLSALVSDGDLMSFDIVGDGVDDLERHIYLDLFGDESMRDRFTESYAAVSSTAIQMALQGSDELALRQVRIDDQQTEDSWKKQFAALREKIGTCLELPFEKSSVEWFPDKKSGVFEVLHTATSAQGCFEISTEIKFFGVRSLITKLTVNRVGDYRPWTLSAPEGWTTTTAVEGVTFATPGEPTREVYEDGEICYTVENFDVRSRFSVSFYPESEDVESKPSDTLKSCLDPALTHDEATLEESKPAYWHGYLGQIAIFRIGDNRLAIRRDILVGKKRCCLLWYTEDITYQQRNNVALPFLMSVQLQEKFLQGTKPSIDVSGRGVAPVKPPIPIDR
jgi:Ca2+-binding EF-hand superfamily protein